MKMNCLLIIDAEASTKKSLVKIEDFPWNFDELPVGWSKKVLIARGLETSVYSILPGASFPLHNVPDEFIGIMINGEMILEVSELNGNVTDTIVCTTGDQFSLSGHVHHAWRNESKEPAMMAFTRKL